jgi:hypothetical protein
MKRKKNNECARDLWAQVFARAAGSEFAALQDPNHDEAADEARISEGLRASGWSEDLIQLVIERHRQERAIAPVTSPGVNPFVETHLARLSNDVEFAMDYLKLDSHAKVARGVEPRAWVSASKINVIMTEQSIVTVNAFLFRFCGLVARAFIRTVRLDPYHWDGDRFDIADAQLVLRKNPEILRYWLQIYLSFAATGTHINVRYWPSTPDEVIPFEDVARAMEIFVVAHEYGHHHYQHGRAVDADPHTEEFEADRFALRISAVLAEQRLTLPKRLAISSNPYLESGAGAIIMLMALDTLRAVEQALGFSDRWPSDTHPETSLRIRKFESVALLQPAEFARLKHFRTAAAHVMTLVRDVIVPAIPHMPAEDLRKFAQLRTADRS